MLCPFAIDMSRLAWMESEEKIGLKPVLEVK
jgi:hypothetical protein